MTDTTRLIEEARRIADKLYGLPGDTLYRVDPANAEAVAVTIRKLCNALEGAK